MYENENKRTNRNELDNGRHKAIEDKKRKTGWMVAKPSPFFATANAWINQSRYPTLPSHVSEALPLDDVVQGLASLLVKRSHP